MTVFVQGRSSRRKELQSLRERGYVKGVDYTLNPDRSDLKEDMLCRPKIMQEKDGEEEDDEILKRSMQINKPGTSK